MIGGIPTLSESYFGEISETVMLSLSKKNEHN
jgi:hypothetical protein